MKPRPYQQAALDASRERLEAGIDTQLIVLPTGGGKTVVFSHMIKQRAPIGPVVVLAHRDELLTQGIRKLLKVDPELGWHVGKVKANHNDTGRPIIFASVQTLAVPSRLAEMPTNVGTLIIDEAHHAIAPTYTKAIEHMQPQLLVGVTATPRPETKHQAKLEDVFKEVVYARSIEEMIREGYLVPPRGVQIRTQVDLANVKTSRGDFQAADLANAIHDAGAVDDVVDTYLEHGEGRKGIVFCANVANAMEMTARFKAAGIAAAEVDGNTPRDQRNDTLRKLTTGEIQIVCNVGVLTEGYDEPSLEVVIVATPTKSSVKYVQMVGRGLRPFPGKTDCLVLDMVGVTQDLSLRCLPEMFGLDLTDGEEIHLGENIIESIDRITSEREEARIQAEADEAEKERLRRARRRRQTKAIEFFDRSKINWLIIEGRWAMPAGNGEYLVLDPWPVDSPDDNYRALLIRQTGAKILAGNLDIGYAMGVAEEVARVRQVTALVNSEAKWRRKAASPGQYKKAKALGVPLPAGTTKGEAADRINKALVSEKLAQLDDAVARLAAEGKETIHA